MTVKTFLTNLVEITPQEFFDSDCEIVLKKEDIPIIDGIIQTDVYCLEWLLKAKHKCPWKEDYEKWINELQEKGKA